MQNLDEAQGLTSEQLASWLLRNGWVKKPQYAWQLGGSSVLTGYHFCKQDAVLATGSPLHDSIAQLAEIDNRDLQSLLREINPRMRRGVPSEAARKSHGQNNGLWVQMFGDGEPCFIQDCISFYVVADNHAQCVEWSRAHVSLARYWPCDEFGNKIRWPTDAQGNML